MSIVVVPQEDSQFSESCITEDEAQAPHLRKTWAVLAELGTPLGSAAVTLKASAEALLKCMPRSKDEAMTQDELFPLATIPCRTTGQNALKQLLAAGRIQRTGKGIRGNSYRYFIGATRCSDAARGLS